MTNIMSERARKLRREKTDAERRLWQALRELNRHGYQFRQQAPIGPYIADFADHTAKIVVEVDGGQHGEPKMQATDAARTRWLEANGYRVLRFWNTDVLKDTPSVMDSILRNLDQPSWRKEASR